MVKDVQGSLEENKRRLKFYQDQADKIKSMTRVGFSDAGKLDSLLEEFADIREQGKDLLILGGNQEESQHDEEEVESEEEEDA